MKDYGSDQEQGMSGQGSGEIAPHRYLWGHRGIQQAFAECPQDMSCCRVGNGEHVPSPDARVVPLTGGLLDHSPALDPSS